MPDNRLDGTGKPGMDTGAGQAVEKRGRATPIGAVGLLGIPWDENSSYLRGAAQGPQAIRRALHCGSANLCAENGVDLSAEPLFSDLGDLDFSGAPPPVERIRTRCMDLLQEGNRLLALGGDHALTWPVVDAFSTVYDRITVIHFDAHPDLYDKFDGNRLSHASPFARIMERGRVARLVQVGVRTFNAHQRNQAARFGVEVLGMDAVRQGLPGDLAGPVYLSLDLDVLDPAFAPGVSHHEPGGLSVRELLGLIQGLGAAVVGADIVEYNPRRDVQGMTAMVAAKCLKEIAGLMIAQGRGLK